MQRVDAVLYNHNNDYHIKDSKVANFTNEHFNNGGIQKITDFITNQM